MVTYAGDSDLAKWAQKWLESAPNEAAEKLKMPEALRMHAMVLDLQHGEPALLEAAQWPRSTTYSRPLRSTAAPPPPTSPAGPR